MQCVTLANVRLLSGVRCTAEVWRGRARDLPAPGSPMTVLKSGNTDGIGVPVGRN